MSLKSIILTAIAPPSCDRFVVICWLLVVGGWWLVVSGW